MTKILKIELDYDEQEASIRDQTNKLCPLRDKPCIRHCAAFAYPYYWKRKASSTLEWNRVEAYCKIIDALERKE